ncbi:Putative uncharacterized protein [Moritella viscosa]|uniref:helix-turn-helix transcriptional regulator n=1 Tax=Moritella viscosa TaxID=80854 RepID=UPI000922E7CD|nr:helix-turn-helix transcriptional regulator [Moritella viscosa]SHO23581.1 Putative uncharacterized protein [Moritella viscosa]
MLKNVLREAREALHLKQTDVAEYVGVTTQTYLKWENGKNEPKASHLKKLTEILKITGSELIEGELINNNVDQLSFMKKVSPARKFIDDVTFMSLIYDGIENKNKFLLELDQYVKKTHGFGLDYLDTMPYYEEDEILQQLKDIEEHEQNLITEEELKSER